METTVSYLLMTHKSIWIQSKKNFEIKPYPLCLGNISKDFTANNMKRKWLNEYVCNFSVDYNIIDTTNIINIHKYLMQKHDLK